MMSRDSILAQTLLQRQRNPFSPSPAERKDQSRLMLANQLRDRIVHRVPMRMSRQRSEFRTGRDHFDIDFAPDRIGADDLHGPWKPRAVITRIQCPPETRRES